LKIIFLRIFTANFGARGDAAGPLWPILRACRTKNFPPRIQCDTGNFQGGLCSVHLTRGGFLRHCLACGRALQNCVRRASHLSKSSINGKLANDARGRTGV